RVVARARRGAAMTARHSKDLARARLQALDELRRDRELSIATRLVGWEIFCCANRKSGCAFPSEQTIAHRLKIDERSVRRAIKQLAAMNYIKVTAAVATTCISRHLPNGNRNICPV